MKKKDDTEEPAPPSAPGSETDDDDGSSGAEKSTPRVGIFKRLWHWLDLDFETVKMMAK